ncbi:MAG: acylphosphatase [Gemmatimonadaceae bacterium]
MPVTHVEILGRVQGVGFRWFARELARTLDLAGWVMNREDGAVELAVTGDEEKVRQFLDALERGPVGSQVESVRPLPIPGTATLTRPFTILR